jgi:CheY-like chemotaxis protein
VAGLAKFPVSVASPAFQPVGFSDVLHFWSTTTLVVINTTKAGLCPLSDGATLRPMSIRQKPGLVAIVDDDESLQRALQDLIESDGLSARCFGSAEQFLESTARHEAACLIADIRMPGMSGLDLQAKLKGERCRIPIIFITAHGDAEMRILAMREGAVEFLTKPFDDAILLEIVRAAVEN